MKEIIKAVFSCIIFFIPVSSFGQWTSSYLFNEYYNVIRNNTRSSICFSSGDTGYIAAGSIYTNKTYYFQSFNQGVNWSLTDSTTNFFAHDIEFKSGVGLSYGYSNDTAALEIFTQGFNDSKVLKATGYRDILQVDPVDSNNAVFMGIDNDSNYVIGVITIADFDLNMVTKSSFGKNKIDKIDFFSLTKGWYQYQNNLYYTENLGVSNQLMVSEIYDFDFYSIDSGVYIASDTWNKKLYKTFDTGKNWHFVTDLYTATNYIGAIMNTGNSVSILYDWQGTSASSTIMFVDLKNDTSTFNEIYREYFFPNWDLYYFSKDQGYFVNCYGLLIYTLNNGNYTGNLKTRYDETVITLYPNPVDDILSIAYSDDLYDRNKMITIMDLNGRIIEKLIVRRETLSSFIDVSGFSPGIYIVNTTIEDTQYISKFIKF